MAETYFDMSQIKELSDFDLMVKQRQLEMKLGTLTQMPGYIELYNQILELYNAYTDEIDRRVEEDIIDIDEVEEQIYDKHIF